MKTMTRWMLSGATIVALTVAPAAGQDQVRSAEQIASDIEAAAATLHDQAHRWSEVAMLYETAAELRSYDDAQSQHDLFVAANLYLKTGNVGRAIAALEKAGTRALQSGEAGLARDRFADAALVAQRAGLSREHQRLSYRTAEVASAAGLAPTPVRGDLVGSAPFRW